MSIDYLSVSVLLSRTHNILTVAKVSTIFFSFFFFCFFFFFFLFCFFFFTFFVWSAYPFLQQLKMNDISDDAKVNKSVNKQKMEKEKKRKKDFLGGFFLVFCFFFSCISPIIFQSEAFK